MKEYKFRAWDSLAEKMYSWTELLNQNLKNIFTIPEQCGYHLMQYTGLKDKNGKEIYEGDIIFIKGETKLLDIKGKVEYSNTFAQFIITNTGSVANETEPLGDYEEENIEVIGNIYDNPELLEEGE